jgi:cytochrome c oxidase subunit 4
MSDVSAEHRGGHTKVYWAVGATLFVLTVVTVAASFLEFKMLVAVLIGLLIAGTKASLVALYFMHLSHERKLIYAVLVLTIVFFFVLLLLPLYEGMDSYATGPVYVP